MCIESIGICLFMPECSSGCWDEDGDCACALRHRMQATASSQLLRRIAMIALLRKRQPVEACHHVCKNTVMIVEENYSPASSRSLFRVGLCLSCLSFRFLLAGSVRVGGGVPIARRAAAFTADAARNGLGLRILDGTIRLSRSVRNGYRYRRFHHA